MITFIVGIIFLIGLIVCLFVAKAAHKDGETGVRNGLIAGSVFLFFLFALCIFFSCFVIVPQTQAAVPVTVGKIGETLNDGLNPKLPWTKVYTFPTRPVTIEVAGEDRIVSRTADSGQVFTAASVRWKVDKEKAPDLYLQVRTGDDGKISEDVIEKNLRQAVSEVYTKLTNLEVVSGDRAATAEAIQKRLQEQVDIYGIIIEDVNLRSVEPDDKTAATLSQLAEKKQQTLNATQDALTASERAKQQVIEAQAQADSAAILATISPEAQAAQCLAIFREAVNKGITMYVNPCGGGGGVSGVIVNGQ